jgi:uncharacterized protein YggU (UPF0235/DUF167 family)
MFIKVKVFPDYREEEVIKKAKDAFEIRVKEKPKMGMANKRVIKILSLIFNVSEGKVRLIKGAREGNKIFEILE